jgi:heat shock protein HslJ
MMRGFKSIVPGWWVALALLLLLAPSLAAAQTSERCFPETGFCISGRIREFWERNGGLRVFGYPTGPQQALPTDNGATVQGQWFERVRLELHPENARPYDVLLGRVGVDALAAQGRDWFAFPKADPNQVDAARCRFFAETSHTVCDDFLAAFRRYGLNLGRAGVTSEESLALFGLPISQPLTETIEGKEYQVQWFERARFELHPENPANYRVLFGRLGAELTGFGGGAAQPGGLAGSSWVLASYGPPDAQTPAAGEPATLAFGTDGRVTGTTGCNNLTGPYSAAGGKLTIGPLATTRRACLSDAANAQEQAIVATLNGAVGYERTSDRLRITSADGKTVLTYTGAAAPAGSSTSPALIGTQWTLTGYGPTANQTPAVADKPATVAFNADGSLTGSTGCNGFGGGYSLAGSQITFKTIAGTLIACEGPIADQERAIFAAFQGARSFTLQGDTLKILYDNGNSALIFTAGPLPTVGRPLVGTTWKLDSYTQTDSARQARIVTAAVADKPATVTFKADGTLSGNTGCNGFGGSYTLADGAITFGNIISTLIACEEPVADQERAILSDFQGTRSYTIQGDTLTITSDNGQRALTFTAAAAQAAVTGTVTYRERSALPPTATVTVQLLDVSRADAPAAVIAEQVIQADGKQVPFSFSLAYDPAQIDPRHTYSVRATIKDGDRLLFTSAQAYPVITNGNPTNVEIVVQRA